MSGTRRKIGAEMKVQMFKAVDAIDGKISLFAVRGDRVCATTYKPWSKFLDKEKFNFDRWVDSSHYHSRMINPELIWESEE